MAKSSIELSIGVNDAGVKSRLAAISKAVKDLGLQTEAAFAAKNMEALGVKSFAAVKEQMAGLTKAYRDLAASGKASTGELAKALESLRAKNRELYAAISTPPKLAAARDTLGITSHRELQAEIGRVKRAYAELASSGRLSMAELAQAKVAVGRRLDELKAKTNGWRDALAESKGRFIEAAAGAAGMVVASRAAISFESAMADVRKTVGGSPAEVAALGNELLKLSRTIPMSAVELAKIAAAGGQLGIAAGDIRPFVDVTAKMATAFDMTADEAGNAIGKLKNVFSLSIPEIGQFGDAINQLGNTSAARERDIVDVMLRVGGTARQFGLAKEQAAALAAAMLSLGKGPEVASTAINSMLNRMQTATMQSADFQAALAKIGISAEEMAKSVATDPQRAIEQLLDTLSKLEGHVRAEVLTGMFGREFQDDIAVLVGGLETYKDALKQVADQASFAAAMQKEFEVRAATTENKLKTAGNVIWEIGNNIGTGFLPAIKAVSGVIQSLLTPVAELTAAFPKTSAAIASFASSVVVFLSLRSVFSIFKMALAGIGTSATAAFGAASTSAGALVGRIALLAARASLLGTTFLAAFKLGEWLTMRKELEGIAEAQGDLTRNTNRLAQASKEASLGFDLSKAGINELSRLTKEGKIHYDELTNTWKAGAAEQAAATRTTAATMKQATGEALEAMKKKYQEYAAEVKRLQGEIGASERSLAAQLREMARTGMSDRSAWADQKREAAEYEAAAKKAAEEAQKALAAGDTVTAKQKFADAVSLANQAKDSYAALNKEVVDGDKVIISKQEALKTSMAGVKQAGELAISLLKEQQTAFAGLMDNLVGESGFADLTAGMDEAERVWLQNWEKMGAKAIDVVQAVEERLEKLVREERTVWVNVRERQARAEGGLIQRLARGGRLPGYGGGDRIPALLEAGEYVIRKEAVSRFGAGLFNALNNLRLPEIPRMAMGGAVGGSPAEIHALDISLGGSYAGRLTGAPVDVRAITKAFQRAERLRSK